MMVKEEEPVVAPIDATGDNPIEKFTPEEDAAARFSYLLPFVRRSGKNMSAKAMTRVIHALAEFPLGNSIDINEMGFRSKQEKQLFTVMYEINAAKHTVLNYIKDEQAKLKKEKEESHVETTSETKAE